MSGTVKGTWLKDNNGNKIAPKTVINEVLLPSGANLSTDYDVVKNKSNDAYSKAIDNANNIENLNTRIDNLIVGAGGNSPIEVTDAHVGADGTTYPTLKHRLDAENAGLKEDLNQVKNTIGETTTYTKDNLTIIEHGYFRDDGTIGNSSKDNIVGYFACEKNTKYVLSRKTTNSETFGIGCTNWTKPEYGTRLQVYVKKYGNDTTLEITTNDVAESLCISVNPVDLDGVTITTYEDYINTMKEEIRENGIDNNYATLGLFQNFGVIGDSYASGVLGNYGNIPHYGISWAQILARRCGNVATNFSYGGLSTRTWLTHQRGLSLLQTESAKQLYICDLGRNDEALGSSYIGNIEDIEVGSDTFYGNYGTIIKAIQAKNSNAKIILLVAPEIKNNLKIAIKNIAEHFNIPYIECSEDTFFTTRYEQYKKVGHPVATEYSGMALAIDRLFSKCADTYHSYFENYRFDV